MKISSHTRSNELPEKAQPVRELSQNCHWQSQVCHGESERRNTQVFCFVNQKGGVGKSSSCFHLAGAYAAQGLSVLIIDTDPQGSISQGFFGSESVEQLPPDVTVAALFASDWNFRNWNALIHETRFAGIHVCPANQGLAEFNTPRPEDAGPVQYALREFLDEQTAYDIVLIDCPPNLYRCTWTAMVAADWVIIPLTPEDFGTQGLRAVHQAVEHAQLLNTNLLKLGHLVTRSDGRLLVHKHYERRLRKRYGDLVLDNFLPELSDFKLAVANRSPVQSYRRRSRAARLTQNLSREILDRTHGSTKGQRAA